MSAFPKKARAGKRADHVLVKSSYTSKPISIPTDFLSVPKEDPAPVTYAKIDFARTVLPGYAGYYAVVLDNVLSASECEQLIKFSEESAGAGDAGVENEGWQPALVNAGGAYEMNVPDYRNSDRIIWDSRDVVERLWERCLLAPGLKEDLAFIEDNESVLGYRAVSLGHRWKVSRLNERMRFLRYGRGQFFKEHCDGTYETPDGKERTFYTLHLYLNDSENANPGSTTEEGPLRGGATTFHSGNMEHRLDVDPKAGRVLIFQHSGLLHSGDDVKEGLKYTLRTDILYKFDETCGQTLSARRGKK